MEGARKRRERNRSEMRASVLDAAQKLVTESGIEKLSLRGIAREIGYSPAAIYEYFESLEDIVHQLYYQGTGGLNAVLLEANEKLPADTDSVSAMLAMGAAFRAHALKDKEVYRFAYNVMKQPHPELAPEEQENNGLVPIIETIHEGIERGEFIDESPFAITIALWAGVHGFVSLEVSDHFTYLRESGLTDIQGTAAIDALFNQFMVGLLRGWCTEKGRELLPS